MIPLFFRRHKVEPHITIETERTFLFSLPFEPSFREVFYCAGQDNMPEEHFLLRNQQRIRRRLKRHYCFFTHLPSLDSEKRAFRRHLRYSAPYIEDTAEVDIPVLGNDYLLQFCANEADRKLLSRPCLIKANPRQPHFLKEHDREFFVLPIETVAREEEAAYAERLADAIGKAYLNWPDPSDTGVRYRMAVPNEADLRFDDDMKSALARIGKDVDFLRGKGISRALLKDLILPEPPLSPLHITRDFRLYLPLYGNREIQMTPLVKSVYLLFLRHPEGIAFKNLTDYRAELAQIYAQVKARRPLYNLAVGLLKINPHIEALTDPLNNSINEKCARIRQAFLLTIDDDMARHYYITGARGEPKRITLPQDKIVWED